MKEEKRHYNNLDLLRVILCISILLYHLNILKNGYLAVCSFFVLTGYLSCISAFKNEKFSLSNYYKNRLLRVYLPLLIVTLVSIMAISFFKSINWMNLKPETTSVLLGYNNYWQLNANLDYFARHIDSPFMHFWYTSILLQFELIFPLIFIIFKKINQKLNKRTSCILLSFIAIALTIYFYIASKTENTMVVYYDSTLRLFSIIYGISLGFIHHYYNNLILKDFKGKTINKIIFYAYLIILIGILLSIDNDFKLLSINMILTTLITCRLIEYATINTTNNNSILNKIIHFISNISYEIYLIQYPIIFIFQYIEIDNKFKIPSIIIIIFIISYILHTLLDFKKYKNKLKYILLIPLIIITIYGGYIYIISEDHSQEMKELEALLNKNEEIMNKKLEEYKLNTQQKETEWQTILDNLENIENELHNVITNLNVIGIGDSVMLGAINSLYGMFPNGYFDAQISRTDYDANNILSNLKYNNLLGNPIVIHLGTNGQCGESCRQVILQTAENRDIFWINVTNDWQVGVNNDLKNFADRNANVRLIDWNSISQGHNEYFAVDGIHLTNIGREAYTKAIYDAIYNMYLEKYNQEKEKILTEHDDYLKKQITFYGNKSLLNAYSDIQNNFENANFITDKDLTYEKLITELKNNKENNTLTYKIVIILDNDITITNQELQEIIEICNQNRLYIVKINNQKITTDNNNVKIINFYEEIKQNKNYLTSDKIHLSSEGNEALSKVLAIDINEN